MARRTQPLVLDISAETQKADAGVKALRSTMLALEGSVEDVNATARQFYSELSGGGAEATVRQLDSAYNKMFRSIRANAQQIAAQGSDASALGLFDIQAAERQVEESARLAAIYQRVSVEAAEAAAKGGEYTTELKQLAAATAIEAAAEDDRLNSLQRSLGAMQALGGATEVEIAQSQRAAVSAGQRRAAYQQLGFQVNDVALQFASGTPIAQIFGQQLGQVTQAVGLLSNSSKGFIGFLSGPWGIGLGAAAVVLAPLVGKLFEGNDALEQATKKLREEARETEISRRAKEAYNATLEGQIALTRELTEELRQSVQTQRQVQLADANRAQRQIEIAQSTKVQKERELTAAEERLQGLQRQQRGATGDEGLRLSLQAGQARNTVERLRSEIASLDTQLESSARAFRLAQEPLISGDIESAMDRKAAATARFTAELGRLNNQLDIGPGNSATVREFDGQVFRNVNRQGIGTVEYERRRQALEDQQRVEIERIDAEEREAQRRARSRERESPLATQFRRPVEGGRITGQFGEQRSGHRHGGVDIAVPVGTPVVAPAAGTVTGAQQRGDYGNVITINFGGKTEGRFAHLSNFQVASGDTVEAGQIIGQSGGARGAPGAGNSQGPHLHYEIRRNSRAVDPFGGPFPTDASQASEEAAELQERAAEEALERARAFEDQLDQARGAQLGAWLNSAVSAEERARIEETLVAGERQSRDAQIARQVTDGELTQAQADQLTEIHHTTDAIEDETKTRRERQDLLDRELREEQAAIDAQGSLLSLQLDFAETLDERRRIARQLLELELEERRRVAQRLLASDNPEDRAAGQRELNRADAEEPFRRRQLERDNEDPLQRYFTQLRAATADMDTAFSGLQANALQGLEDDLVGVISGTESLADAFTRMTASILADLARIAIQNAILGIVGGLTDGGGGGASGFLGGGGLSGVTPLVGQYSGPDLGFAGGGAVRGPGTATSDSIVARLSNGEFVLDAATYRQYGPLIDALHAGRLPGFAEGGLVGIGDIKAPRLPDLKMLQPANDGGGSGAGTVVIKQTNNFAGGAVTQEDLAQVQQVTVAAAMYALDQRARRAG